MNYWLTENHMLYPLLSVTFSSAATKSLSSFLGSVVGVHFEKHRARNDAVSARTDGVLCSSAAMQASLIASTVVYIQSIRISRHKVIV